MVSLPNLDCLYAVALYNELLRERTPHHIQLPLCSSKKGKVNPLQALCVPEGG